MVLIILAFKLAMTDGYLITFVYGYINFHNPQFSTNNYHSSLFYNEDICLNTITINCQLVNLSTITNLINVSTQF